MMDQDDFVADDDDLMLGMTRPKVVAIPFLGLYLTYDSFWITILIVGITLVSSFSLIGLLVAICLGAALLAGFAWLCAKDIQWFEIAKLAFRTRLDATLSGTANVWGASTFSPLVIDFPDDKGQRRHTVNLLLVQKS